MSGGLLHYFLVFFLFVTACLISALHAELSVFLHFSHLFLVIFWIMSITGLWVMVCIRSYSGHPTSVQLLGRNRFVFFSVSHQSTVFSDVLFGCPFVSRMSYSICQSQGMHADYYPTRVARHHRHPSHGHTSHTRRPFASRLVSGDSSVASDTRRVSQTRFIVKLTTQHRWVISRPKADNLPFCPTCF